MIAEWIKTQDILPPANMKVELLCYGSAVSCHIEGKYAIMRYDGGNWWNMDGTSLSTEPTYWANINAPNQANTHDERTSMRSKTLDEWMTDWEAEVEKEAATFMSQGMSPSEAGDKARALVGYRQKMATKNKYKDDNSHNVGGCMEIDKKANAIIQTRNFLQRLRLNQGSTSTAAGRRREADALLTDYPLACETRSIFLRAKGGGDDEHIAKRYSNVYFAIVNEDDGCRV